MNKDNILGASAHPQQRAGGTPSTSPPQNNDAQPLLSLQGRGYGGVCIFLTQRHVELGGCACQVRPFPRLCVLCASV